MKDDVLEFLVAGADMVRLRIRVRVRVRDSMVIRVSGSRVIVKVEIRVRYVLEFLVA
jgi:hypothetical protein